MRSNKLRQLRWFILSATILTLCTFGAASLSAQEPSATGRVRGVTAYGEFRGSDSSRTGQVLLWDTSIGYDFTQHFGLDVGVPIYMLRNTADPTTAHPWEKHIGDPYFDLRGTFNTPGLNYATFLTISVPASETGAFSTGRLGVEWYNHFSHAFGGVFEPYVNVGIGDSILDTRLMSQPYNLVQSFKTLGFIASVEPGATIRLNRRFKVGGSYYRFLPYGQQKAYNGIQNFFLQPNGSISVADITHDYGETAFVRMSLNRWLYLEPGYVHSQRLNDNSVTFRVGFDFKAMFDRSRDNSY
jgi:hypothetical protein